ncbi:hypothetical protein OTB20_19470 [Streptomyces sp. H27-H1]|uniref:hypothetical protein n=1 Tax=Streptomyces sp. H27-H1 TaxID=2996461 RepID=UPI0022714FB2|nr:hypothetical protein [Streptomyces sp. H27-H1]MCY0928337.1 hypothetical protein [Streptomyces sp. H27-H1]
MSASASAAPSRLRIVVGRKTGSGPLVLELPPMSDADRAAHVEASYVRRQPSAA